MKKPKKKSAQSIAAIEKKVSSTPITPAVA
jgi:hypothetical protein